MVRETLEAKALRLLAEGRLRVVLVDGERIEARVRAPRPSTRSATSGAAGGAIATRTPSGGVARISPRCSS